MHAPVFCLILVGFAASLAQYSPYSPYPVANARGPSSNGASYSRGPSGAPYGAGQSSRSNGYGGGAASYADIDSYSGPRASEEDPDADGVVGVAGRDYPTYDQVPQTAFSCQDHQFPGIYADTDPQCQVFHICQFDGRHDSFLCPNGSIFNQQYFVCDWWYNVDCSQAPSFYGLNAQLYQDVSSGPRRGGYSSDQYGGQRINGEADLYSASQRGPSGLGVAGAPQVYNGAQRASGARYGGSQGGQGLSGRVGAGAGAGTPVYSSGAGRRTSPSATGGQQQQPGYPRSDTQPIY